MPTRHGGEILADQLLMQGVKRVFSVPGESFLAALDGLYGRNIENVVCRHEGAAAMMAEAHGKLTGQPGIVFATRGPGATNASSGVHVAMHDSTPMILFIGQVARAHRNRDAFQEIDFVRFFSPIAKSVAEIYRTDRIPEYVGRAFQLARTGRPGPVVLSLPEDMLHEVADVADRKSMDLPLQPASASNAALIADVISDSKRPLAIAGGSIWSIDASKNLGRFADAFKVPVATGFRRQDHLDNRHPCYIGDLSAGMNPALAERVVESECILVLGSRLGDIVTRGYELLDLPETGKTILHVHPDPEEPGRVWRANHSFAMPPGAILDELARLSPNSDRRRSTWLADCRREYENWRIPVKLPGAVQLSEIATWLSENLPETAILTNGAGNYAAFLHRHFQYKGYGTQVASTSGSMGYGFPAAISAKLQRPDDIVVCLAGDGCFQMTLGEFSTAIQQGAAVIVIVANNGMYGTIRMHQEMSFPDRVHGTSLINPDFAAFARAYGGHGETVTSTTEFPEAFERALDSGVPSIIELKLDPEAISTSASIDDLKKMRPHGVAALGRNSE